MTENLDLKPRHRAMLDQILNAILPDVEVWAYGSRVNGRSYDGSDLDLVLRGPGLEQIPAETLHLFSVMLRESNIPFFVEARDWARIPEHFHREIERDYVVLKAVQPSRLTGFLSLLRSFKQSTFRVFTIFSRQTG